MDSAKRLSVTVKILSITVLLLCMTAQLAGQTADKAQTMEGLRNFAVIVKYGHVDGQQGFRYLSQKTKLATQPGRAWFSPLTCAGQQ